jgi:enamine deaminase RidA (YjgF/YER057c/UK114 family)
MAHQRFGTSMCNAVRAGGRVFIRGQSGFTLEGGFIGPGDPAAQADQAMRNIRILIEQAGGSVAHLRRLTAYITDRAWRDRVDAAIGRHLGSPAPARVGLIVAGLALPEMLVLIDADAVIPA